MKQRNTALTSMFGNTLGATQNHAFKCKYFLISRKNVRVIGIDFLKCFKWESTKILTHGKRGFMW